MSTCYQICVCVDVQHYGISHRATNIKKKRERKTICVFVVVEVSSFVTNRKPKLKKKTEMK